MAKATPASGVLNAAATPAAPPAMMTPAVTGTRSQRCTATISAALICTVGPSRPTDAPHNSMASVARNFAAAVRSETSAPSVVLSGLWLAAMTCGMPDPRAAGKVRRVR